MDKADGADGSGIKPDKEAEQLINQAFPNDSGINNLNIIIKLSKQIYTELAVKNIITGLTDEAVETNIGNKSDPHVSTSLDDEPEPHVPRSLEDEPEHYAPKSLEEEIEPHGPTRLEEELEPQSATSLGEELELKCLWKELNPKSLRVELNGPTSQSLECLFIYPKADDSSKAVTSESFEPNTSDLLEQTDAKPEQIVKEELEYIFEHSFDSVAQKEDDNSKTDLQQSADNSGGSFQDIEVRNAIT